MKIKLGDIIPARGTDAKFDALVAQLNELSLIRAGLLADAIGIDLQQLNVLRGLHGPKEFTIEPTEGAGKRGTGQRWSLLDALRLKIIKEVHERFPMDPERRFRLFGDLDEDHLLAALGGLWGLGNHAWLSIDGGELHLSVGETPPAPKSAVALLIDLSKLTAGFVCDLKEASRNPITDALDELTELTE